MSFSWCLCLSFSLVQDDCLKKTVSLVDSLLVCVGPSLGWLHWTGSNVWLHWTGSNVSVRCMHSTASFQQHLRLWASNTTCAHFHPNSHWIVIFDEYVNASCLPLSQSHLLSLSLLQNEHAIKVLSFSLSLSLSLSPRSSHDISLCRGHTHRSSSRGSHGRRW